MTLEEYVESEKAAVRNEERKRADEAEKRADRAEQQLVASIRKLMNGPNGSADDAMDILGVEPAMRDYYKAML